MNSDESTAKTVPNPLTSFTAVSKELKSMDTNLGKLAKAGSKNNDTLTAILRLMRSKNGTEIIKREDIISSDDFDPVVSAFDEVIDLNAKNLKATTEEVKKSSKKTTDTFDQQVKSIVEKSKKEKAEQQKFDGQERKKESKFKDREREKESEFNQLERKKESVTRDQERKKAAKERELANKPVKQKIQTVVVKDSVKNVAVARKNAVIDERITRERTRRSKTGEERRLAMGADRGQQIVQGLVNKTKNKIKDKRDSVVHSVTDLRDEIKQSVKDSKDGAKKAYRETKQVAQDVASVAMYLKSVFGGKKGKAALGGMTDYEIAKKRGEERAAEAERKQATHAATSEKAQKLENLKGTLGKEKEKVKKEGSSGGKTLIEDLVEDAADYFGNRNKNKPEPRGRERTRRTRAGRRPRGRGGRLGLLGSALGAGATVAGGVSLANDLNELGGGVAGPSLADDLNELGGNASNVGAAAEAGGFMSKAGSVIGKVGKFGGKLITGAGIVMAGADLAGNIGTANDTTASEEDRKKAKNEAIGGGVGAVLGGIAGSFIPVIGTAIGATLGESLGSTVGEYSGEISDTLEGAGSGTIKSNVTNCKICRRYSRQYWTCIERRCARTINSNEQRWCSKSQRCIW